MSTLPPGARIGPYEVLSFLASGGMGEVYRAHDERLGRTVAMKVLPEAMFGDAEAVLRFEREARAAAAVAHPNLISIHDVGRAGEVHYLVMDLLDGMTLRTRLASGALPWREAVEIARGVCEGIAAVHAKGFVHRDLKPENIFLTSEGWVKVLDFGLALPQLPVSDPDDETMRLLTQRGVLVGTVSYMAPEQLRGHEIDWRADLFAIGCVLYEMLAGQALFGRETHADTIAAILSTETCTLPVEVPASLETIVQRCVARPREERFQSAAELLNALRDIRDEPRRRRRDSQTLAVLPFANVGGDKENDYFSEGLAEEILTALSGLPELSVTARTSAFAFRGKDEDVRRIGEALGVRTVLQGSVRRAGNRVRVTTQLVDTTSGFQRWSARYDAAMDDVFEVQDEIASSIVEKLQVGLASRKMAVRHPTSVEAWHAYLKSRYHFGKLSPQRLALSRAAAEEAIALDPTFAAAYAQLAECFIQTAVYGLRPSAEMLPLAREAAAKAAALDEAEPNAQMTLARIAGEYEGNWSEALRRCRLALAVEKVTPVVRALCAQYVLWPMGRYDEMNEAVRPAVAADPLSPMPRFVLAQAAFTSGDRVRAIEEIRAVVELHEHFWPGFLALATMHVLMGEVDPAIVTLEKSMSVAPWQSSTIGMLAGCYVKKGMRERGLQLLKQLDAPEFSLLRGLGDTTYSFVLGDYETAARHMKAVIEAKYPVAVFYTSWLALEGGFREAVGPLTPALSPPGRGEGDGSQ